ncbi:MAG TPA: hypothetical protein VII06_08150 [Chloroflexota bacterium]|jgi:hypothetical protein
MPELSQVPEDDQGIDFDNPVRDGAYPLKEMSTGERITEDGEAVYVDDNGNRVSA